YIDSLQPLLPESCQIWKALPVESEVPDLMNNAQFHILDGKNAGSGETFNWRALAESEQDLTQCFLAGGLSIDNIEQAISQKTSLDLFGLDLNSGVETSPGVKSRGKLQQVFAAIRHY
ncbi:MAG: indole-3-glycerol phosphate synthase/phosphoribosylanthranilate isomerase, partial [Colwellia sp.]